MTDREVRDAGGRRLTVLRVAVLALGLLLAGRVIYVQGAEHDRWLARANDQWSREVVIDAERGNLYDRNGRPLAVSVTTTQLGVTRRFLETDPAKASAMMQDLVEASNLDAREIGRKLAGDGKGHAVLASGLVLKADLRERLRRWKCVTLDERCTRYYPTDGMGASVVGFYRQDPDQVHAMGLELSLEKHLAGKPGRAREIQTARAGVKLGRVVLENATHGRSLVLTLDAGLQEICEQRLKDAVETTGAAGGSVLVLDPSNGDVLAAASWPLMDTRNRSHEDGAVWNNRNFTTAFEPGSLFKVFSGAALLHHGAVDTGTVFNCDNNSGSPFGISNDKHHDYGHISFASALSVSSNVYFAKAVMRLDSAKLYGTLADFGFGERTQFPYSAQPRGELHKPEAWNGRDKPAISIGQAVSTTALQLGMALCAVANGGTLYSPRCIKEYRGRDGGAIEEVQPVALRRVMAPPLAEVLRGAMGRVVEYGTGKATKLDWITSGGKTGTAQKAREGARGYADGAYMASFGGIVPIDDPRLVVLVVMDEPDRAHHYASQSAVPLYRAVVEDIRRCSDWLSDVPGKRTGPVAQPDPLKLVQVPDVLYLRTANASERIGSAGLRVVGDGRPGTVVGQVPAAGTRCEAGTEVVLTVAPPRSAPAHAAAQDTCPSFLGKSNREILAEATRLGLQVVIEGVGYAAAQDIPPGGPRPSGPIRVTMETTWN